MLPNTYNINITNIIARQRHAKSLPNNNDISTKCVRVLLLLFTLFYSRRVCLHFQTAPYVSYWLYTVHAVQFLRRVRNYLLLVLLYCFFRVPDPNTDIIIIIIIIMKYTLFDYGYSIARPCDDGAWRRITLRHVLNVRTLPRDDTGGGDVRRMRFYTNRGEKCALSCIRSWEWRATLHRCVSRGRRRRRCRYAGQAPGRSLQPPSCCVRCYSCTTFRPLVLSASLGN